MDGPPLQPRPYQLECLARVLAANTIACLPTGAGKTLIATLAIDHFLSTGPPPRKALFIVPTVVLVAQQARRCRENCRGALRVREVSGIELEHWGAPAWRVCVDSHDVLVGTPEVFRRAMVDLGALSPVNFALVIFDECHNAIGNSPMAAICRDALSPAARAAEARGGAAVPRILGLTASFVNGSLKDIEAKRVALESLLQANVFCPAVPPEFAAGAPGTGEKFERVSFAADPLPPGADAWVMERIESIVGAFEGFAGIPVRGIERTVRSAVTVLEELGSDALCCALRDSVIRQLETAAEQFAAVQGRRGVGERTSAGLGALSRELASAADALAADPHLRDLAPTTSRKTQCLLKLVGDLFCDNAADDSFRGIIFVDRIALTIPLARLLDAGLEADPWQLHGINVRAISGVGSMSASEREAAMAAFHAGRSRVVVCTAALEEGVDVSDCAFVIRFSGFDTTKSHIQGSGRARRPGAKVFYFENDPDEEEAGARLMTAVARNASLALSPAEMTTLRDDDLIEVPGVHPFHPTGRGPAFGGSEVNLNNCVVLVYEYCAKVMSQSVPPDFLLSVDDCDVVTAIAVPTPRGVVRISSEDADALWGGIPAEDAIPAGRRRALTRADLERNRILYTAALHLYHLGLLGPDNMPTLEALTRTRTACPRYPHDPGVRLRDRYPEAPQASLLSSPQRPAGVAAALASDLPRAWGSPLSSRTPPIAGPSPWRLLSPQTPRVPAFPFPSSRGSILTGSSPPLLLSAATSDTGPTGSTDAYAVHSADGGTPSRTLSVINYKGSLNEWAMARWRCPAPDLVRYTTTCSPSSARSFVACVELLREEAGCARRSFTGRACATKKEAEQDAARVALESVVLGGSVP